MHETRKLFYGKYPYKLTLRTSLCSYFSSYYRDNSFKNLKKRCNAAEKELKAGSIPTTPWLWLRGEQQITESDVKIVRILIRHLEKYDDYKSRGEFGTLTLFLPDDQLWKKLKTLHELDKDHKFNWWEPKSDISSGEVIMKSKEFTEWKYRVNVRNTIKPVPDGFYAWAMNNQDKIKAGSSFWFHAKNRNGHGISGTYFYIKSEKMLSLLTLMMGDKIKNVDKVVVRDTEDQS